MGLVVHLLTVFVLLLKGADKLTKSHLVSGSSLVLLGLLILVLIVLEKRYHWSHALVRQACLLIEAVALAIMAVVFYQEGKVYLPYVFGACAITYLIVALVAARKNKTSAHSPNQQV